MKSIGFYYGNHGTDPHWLLDPDPPEPGVDYPEWHCTWCGLQFDSDEDPPQCPVCKGESDIQRNNPPIPLSKEDLGEDLCSFTSDY